MAIPKLPLMQKPTKESAVRISAFIYGISGAGKTFLARSLLGHPDLYPALVVVCDNGELSITDLIGPDFGVIRGTFATLEDVFEILSAKPPSKYRSLFIDNISQLQQNALSARSEAGQSAGRAAYELTQQDYGIARNQLNWVIGAFATRPEVEKINLFVTALAQTELDEATGARLTVPALAGKTQGEIPALFDVVGYLERKTPKASEMRKAELAGKTLAPWRELTVNQTSSVLFARNRGNLLGEDVVRNPTLPELYKRMTGK